MSDSKMDFFELGDKTALICADALSGESIRQTLRDLGFKFHTAETSEAAIDRIRYTQYDCIVIHENFAGSSLRSNSVLNFLGPQPMAVRRYSFVCVIGPSLKTLDAMQAFALSVHLVVNSADVPNMQPILKKGLAEFELLYRAYKEILSTKGEK